MNRTRLLRWLVLAFLVPLAGLVVWQLVFRGQGASTDSPRYSGGEGHATGLNKFEIHGTTEGQPDYRLRAEDLGIGNTGTQVFEGLEFLEIYRRDGRTIRITGREGGLPRGRVDPTGSGGEARVRIEGGVRLEEPGGPVVETEWLEFDRAGHVVWTDDQVDLSLDHYRARAGALRYRTDKRELVLTDGVHAHSQSGEGPPLELRAPRLHYDLTTRRAEVPRSEAGGLVLRRGVERVSADHAVFALARRGEPEDQATLMGRVQGTLLAPDSTGDPVVFAAGMMEARRTAGGGPRRFLVLRQGVRLWWRDPVGSRHTLTAERVETNLGSDGSLHQATARGEAELVLRSVGQEPRRLSAPVIEADLEAGVALTGMRAWGGVRYEGTGGLTVRAGRAGRDRTGKIVLRGQDENIPTILDARRTIVAREIDVLPDGILLARGNVETSLMGNGAGDPGSVGPLFMPDRPVQVRSTSLRLDTGSGESRFHGEVRAVQDDRMLKADLLQVRDDGEAVHGEGDVRVRMFRSGEGAGRVPVLVDADSMDYLQDEETLRFTGEVQYQEDTFSLIAPELLARIAPGGGFTSSTASGGVQLSARGRDEEGRSVEYRGTAARMDYDGASGEAVLFGGEEPARLVNAASGEEFQGPSLRIFLGQDRIVAGGPEHTGRITIKTVLPGDEP